MPLGPELAGEVARRRLERRLGHAHPVVGRPRDAWRRSRGRRSSRRRSSAARTRRPAPSASTRTCCSATATSSHVRLHERAAEAHGGREADGVEHAVDAAPLARRARRRTAIEVLGHRSRRARAPARLGGSLRAVALGERQASAGAGEHDLGALAPARAAATPNASEASVSTPVTTMRLPSSRPMAPPTVGCAGDVRAGRCRVQGSGSCGSASSAAPGPPAGPRRPSGVGRLRRRRSARARSTGRWRCVDEHPRPLARPATWPSTPADNDGAADGRPRRHRHAVGQRRARPRHVAPSSSHGKVVISMANALVRVGKRVPAAGAAPWLGGGAACRRPCPECRGGRRRSTTCRPSELGHLGAADRERRADLLRPSARPPTVVAEIVAKIPDCRPLDAGELSNATADRGVHRRAPPAQRALQDPGGAQAHRHPGVRIAAP